MQSYFEPDPIAVKKAMHTYWIAHNIVLISVVGFCFWLISLLIGSSWGQNILGTFPKQRDLFVRYLPMLVFSQVTTVASFIATIVCRYRGVSLEASFNEKYAVRRDNPVEAGMQTVLHVDRSWCASAMTVAYILGTLGLLFLFAPAPATPWEGAMVGFLGIGIWPTLLWFRGDWFMASTDNEGVILRQGTYLLPGSAKRIRLTWQEISEVEINRQRSVTGGFIGGNVLLREKHRDVVHKIPLIFSTEESRNQFLDRLRKEGGLEERENIAATTQFKPVAQ